MDATRQSRHVRLSRPLAALGALSCALTLTLGIGVPPRQVLAMTRAVLPVAAPARRASRIAAPATTTTIVAWGDNYRGELGTGDTFNRMTPTAVEGLIGVNAVAGGSQFSLALTADGRSWAWGNNDQAQLGMATTEACNDYRCSTKPLLQGLGGVTALSAGSANGMVLTSDGTVWAWGQNSAGQLGDGTTNDAVTPVQVQGLSNVAAIAEGGGFSLALERDGTVWSWGGNLDGELGLGQVGPNGGTDYSAHPHPARLTALGNVVAIAAGDSHALALTADGHVWAWGEGFRGALGLGGDPQSTTDNQPVPVPVPGLAGIKAIAAGSQTSLALATDGGVWAWGDNEDGEVGDGTTADRSSPRRVAGLSAIAAIAAGGHHDVALDANGSVWGWGEDGSGQVGVPATAACGDNGGCVTTPAQVPGVTGATAIAAGSYHTLAIVPGSAPTDTPTATPTPVPPTATSTATPTPIPPTPTYTATPVSLTATSTPTPIPPAPTTAPTATPIPPAPSSTPIPSSPPTVAPTLASTNTPPATHPSPTVTPGSPGRQPTATPPTATSRPHLPGGHCTQRVRAQVSISHGRIAATTAVTLRVSADPAARVAVDAALTRIVVVRVGHGRGHPPITRTLTLYRMTSRSTVDRQGHATIVLRLPYRSPRLLPATLTVTVRSGCATVTSRSSVVVQGAPRLPRAHGPKP